jgi:hypothetical protein
VAALQQGSGPAAKMIKANRELRHNDHRITTRMVAMCD